MRDLLRLTYVELVKLGKLRLTWILLFFLVLILGWQVNSLNKKVRQEPGMAEKVDEYMGALVSSGGQWEMSGAVLVAQEGKVIASNEFGYANKTREIVITPNTRFQLPSIRKPVTALAVMHLQERGLLSVHDPLSDYFPEFTRGGDITLHHLLTHSSGIPDGGTDDPPHALLFEPGTTAVYTNPNYVLLERVIEQVSGQAYTEYIQEHIFNPLDMSDSGFEDQSVGDSPSLAVTFMRGAKGAVVAPPLEGSLFSSLTDLYRLERAMQDGDLVGPDSLEDIFTPYIDGWGYGWRMQMAFDREMATQGGVDPGARGSITRFPDDDVVIIFLSNTDWASEKRIVLDLATILFGEPYTLPVSPYTGVVDVPRERLTGYEGTFASPELGLSIEVGLEEGNLRMRLIDLTAGSKHKDAEMFPVSQSRFYTNLRDTEVEFITEEGGEVNHLLLIREGFPLPAIPRQGIDSPATETLPGTPETADMLTQMNFFLFGAGVKDYYRAATLPGAFSRVISMHDWLNFAIILLGVMAVGQEFTWGTLSAVLSRGVGRTRLLAAKFLALASTALFYLLVLWIASAVIGAVSTRSLAGNIDFSFLDGDFFIAQAAVLARIWLTVLPFIALSLAVHVVAARPVPAFTLQFLIYLLSLWAYSLLPIIMWFFLSNQDFNPADLGETVWGKVVVLIPHYSDRLVAYWAEPDVLAEWDHWMRVTMDMVHLPDDPWTAVLILLTLCGLFITVAVVVFKRKEMRP
jgi:CubicO group peptidase (beta-lactamase class C family)/ABC-type transport system involved in multi-copper enzyme maturation permease subunit